MNIIEIFVMGVLVGTSLGYCIDGLRTIEKWEKETLEEINQLKEERL